MEQMDGCMGEWTFGVRVDYGHWPMANFTQLNMISTSGKGLGTCEGQFVFCVSDKIGSRR